jgi:hypothetical protein
MQPDRVPARPTRFGAVRSAMVADRAEHGRLDVRRPRTARRAFIRSGDEIRALRRLQREQGPSSHVFMTERDGPMTPRRSTGCSAESVPGLICRSGCIRTCSGMAAAMRSPTPATIPERYRLISATKISSTRCATPNLRRIGSRISGGSCAPPGPMGFRRLAARVVQNRNRLPK